MAVGRTPPYDKVYATDGAASGAVLRRSWSRSTLDHDEGALVRYQAPGQQAGAEARMSSRAVKKVRVVLGARVRALREGLGYTQRALGRRARLSGKFIGEVERGEKSITVDSLYRVAQALKTPLGDLTSMNGHVKATRRPRKR